MQSLIQIFSRLLEETESKKFRYLYSQIDWSQRLICITGARGTGKTTMLLQYIKTNFADRSKALYASLDNIWFSQNTLFSLAEEFYNFGGEHLFLDEVHRYPNWSIEIKNIYDSFPKLKIVFTGSSILEIYKSNADLSRRAISYTLKGLSFREFLNFELETDFKSYDLDYILKNHTNIVSDLNSQMKVLAHFRNYLEHGYYPFYKEGIKNYPIRIQNVVNTILDNDLPAIENIEYSSIIKIKKMLMIISSLVPFTPNITSLSHDIAINREQAIKYLHYLQKAALITLLNSSCKGMGLMKKPEKIYLENTNLLYALSQNPVNEGNIRETFFVNQLSYNRNLNTSKEGDFVVDGKYTFEIGGKSKKFKQIKDIPNSYIAMEGIEAGYGNKIPIWLFGFIY